MTDGQIDRRTDKSNTYCPLTYGRGHNNNTDLTIRTFFSQSNFGSCISSDMLPPTLRSTGCCVSFIALASLAARWSIHITTLHRWSPRKIKVTLKLLQTNTNCYETVQVEPFMGTLKPHSNGPLYNNTVIGTLAADGGEGVTFGTAMRGLGGLQPTQM